MLRREFIKTAAGLLITAPAVITGKKVIGSWCPVERRIAIPVWRNYLVHYTNIDAEELRRLMRSAMEKMGRDDIHVGADPFGLE